MEVTEVTNSGRRGGRVCMKGTMEAGVRWVEERLVTANLESACSGV